MIKKSSDEPDNKASERLRQMLDARLPQSDPDEKKSTDPIPDSDTPDPAKKKAAKKSTKKKK